jgi:hypothetical protein
MNYRRAPREWSTRRPSSAKFLSAENSSLKFDRLDFIYVTPGPGLTGLDRPDQGMLAAVIVLGRVLIFRRVAATNVPALQAQSQVNPGVPCLYAVLADMLVGVSYLDLIQVRAFQRHDSSRVF